MGITPFIIYVLCALICCIISVVRGVAEDDFKHKSTAFMAAAGWAASIIWAYNWYTTFAHLVSLTDAVSRVIN